MLGAQKASFGLEVLQGAGGSLGLCEPSAVEGFKGGFGTFMGVEKSLNGQQPFWPKGPSNLSPRQSGPCCLLGPPLSCVVLAWPAWGGLSRASGTARPAAAWPTRGL